jgi:SAM-dependent methyltransferase
MALQIICPDDLTPLANRGSELNCGKCGRHFPILDGVVSTTKSTDEFYEGAYQNQVKYVPRSDSFLHVWPLWLISCGYLWAVRRLVREDATVVEFGAASGVRFFGQRYHMVGCDLSLTSLQRAEFYEQRIQADIAASIPLPDESVDAVISSFFWEHIPAEVKPQILRHCYRILKPGGKLIFLYDVETENPLIRHYKKKNLALYRKLFLEGDGHVGYQTPKENRAIFEGNGFTVAERHGMEKTWLQSTPAYIKLAEYHDAARPLLRMMTRIGEPPFFHLYTALIRMVDSVLCPWLPEDWARIEMTVCERRSS